MSRKAEVLENYIVFVEGNNEIPEDKYEEFLSVIYGMSFNKALKQIMHNVIQANKKEDNEQSTKQSVVFTKPKRYKKACLK